MPIRVTSGSERDSITLTYPTQTEYSNACTQSIGILARTLLSLPLHMLNVLVSLWKETTDEKIYRHENGPCYERYVLLTVGTPILVCVFILSFIPSLIGLALYVCSLKSRENVTIWTNDSKERETLSMTKDLTLLSMNTCLLPTFLAKFNNLSKTKSRSDMMAKILCESPSVDDCSDNSTPQISVDIEDSIQDNLDFICLQEVFDRSAISTLSKGLKS